METKNNSVCPVWIGYSLLIPLRKLRHDPEKILKPHIKPGMEVMDYGSAMGYFSIPLARMTGDTGKVYCVDIQEKMLLKLQKRAAKYGVSSIIRALQVGSSYNTAELSGKLDFVLLFAVLHEVPDKAGLFNDIFTMLRPGGKILFAEPKGHVTTKEFENSLLLAGKAGLRVSEEKPDLKGLCAFLVK